MPAWPWPVRVYLTGVAETVAMTCKKPGEDFSVVLKNEKERISTQRRNRKDISEQLTGLALSGGGIRSASFGLGVLQALAHKKYQVFNKLDYLSTVSGGGYIGSALTWLNHLQKGEQWQFPLGMRGRGARSDEKNTALDYIRQHGNYLTPEKNLSTTSFIATVIRNTLLTSAVYYALLLSLILFGVRYHLITPPGNVLQGGAIQWERVVTVSLVGALAGVLMFVVVTVGYAFFSYAVKGMRRRDYIARIMVQKVLGWMMTLVIALALLASLPIAYALLNNWGTMAAGIVSSAGGVMGGIYEFMRQRTARIMASAPGGIRIGVTSFLLIYGLMLLAYALASRIPAGLDLELVAAYCLFLGLFFGFFINTNYFGLGRMYRDRLMETFLPDMKTIDVGAWNLAKQSDAARLSDMCGEDEHGPYHLVNCNVVMVDSDEAKYRGRGGDSFVLSPLFCGSNATGWHDTRKFLDDGMTLATAMAISGAAANPNTGVAGRGTTRDRLVSFLMAFLGLRLGYWARNPAASGYHRILASLTRPSLLYPGIVQGLMGRRLNEAAGYLELSDGGHFENTGLYELARRRLDVIIVSDAGADPGFSLSDLGDAIERIRVDFGYYIYFDDEEYSLMNLMPGSSTGDTIFDRSFCLARHGFAVGRIEYDETHSGNIIYIKSTLIRDLPGDVYAYKKANPSFPHQSTVDQFFDEVQLEAYRELGYRLCKEMLEMNTRQEKSWV
jgi:Patatin-like phospholipase